MVIYEAFVEDKLEVPKHLARTVHDLYFEPQYEELRPRTIWSLSTHLRRRLRNSIRSKAETHAEDVQLMAAATPCAKLQESTQGMCGLLRN